MIRNENEYQEAFVRLTEERERMEAHRARLKAEGLDAESIDRVIDPIESFHLQLREEVESYERLRKGIVEEVHNLHGLGRVLIGLRVARGMSQKDLAARLSVHESQVSRDERNEYHGFTIERASRILDALGADLASRVAEPVRPFGKSR